MTNYAALLLSQQPLRPCRKTPWVEQTIQAVRWLKEKGYTLLTSTGMQTWELLIALAKLENISQKVIVPSTIHSDFNNVLAGITDQFSLHNTQTTFEPLNTNEHTLPRTELMRLRDARIIDKAHILLPISVKTNSRLLRYVELKDKCSVNHTFSIPYVKRKILLKYHIETKNLNRELYQVNESYIVHWTRTTHSPWPDERAIDYYTAILENDSYPRSAFYTLSNMIRKRRIIASSRHMPGNIATVCFSGCSPHCFVPLMRWRSRYTEMSFEPYGIGIERNYALKIGIKPVVYYTKTAPHHHENWLCQSSGKQGDWQKEKEFRFLGDFDFHQIPNEKLICFCHTPDESKRFKTEFGIKTIPFVG